MNDADGILDYNERISKKEKKCLACLRVVPDVMDARLQNWRQFFFVSIVSFGRVCVRLGWLD